MTRGITCRMHGAMHVNQSRAISSRQLAIAVSKQRRQLASGRHCSLLDRCIAGSNGHNVITYFSCSALLSMAQKQ